MLQENIAFHYWIYLCIYLYLKMFANSMVQGAARFKGNFFNNPEDTEAFVNKKKDVIEKHKSLDERAGKCWRNDLENIPMFLILALGFVLAGAENSVCIIYFAAFAFFRTGHTFFFLRAKQPHRALCFFCGVVTTVAMAGHSVCYILL